MSITEQSEFTNPLIIAIATTIGSDEDCLPLDNPKLQQYLNTMDYLPFFQNMNFSNENHDEKTLDQCLHYAIKVEKKLRNLAQLYGFQIQQLEEGYSVVLSDTSESAVHTGLVNKVRSGKHLGEKCDSDRIQATLLTAMNSFSRFWNSFLDALDDEAKRKMDAISSREL